MERALHAEMYLSQRKKLCPGLALMYLRLTQRAQASDIMTKTGYLSQSISHYETGKTDVTLDAASRFAHYFSITVEEFVSLAMYFGSAEWSSVSEMDQLETGKARVMRFFRARTRNNVQVPVTIASKGRVSISYAGEDMLHIAFANDKNQRT